MYIFVYIFVFIFVYICIFVSGPCKNLLILPKNLPKDSTADLRERRLTYQLPQKS